MGNSPECGLPLDDRKVSRRHVEIEVLTSGLKVRDLGSKNGTFFERSRIEAVELPHHGSVLTVGDSEITLWPDDEQDADGAAMPERCDALVGKSPAMRALFGRIERAAATRATVLVRGEPGTGKGLVAQAIHRLGERAGEPFVVIDCAAIPPESIEVELFGQLDGAQGAFVAAGGGTLFLDHIGELDIGLQPQLLRALEQGLVKPVGGDGEQGVDVRVIAAGHRDLAEDVAQRRFRADLYYRLAVVCLEVPPLRARRDDIPLLVEHFVHELGAPRPSAETLERLCSHPWPGNVSQLCDVLERAASSSGRDELRIEAGDLVVESTAAQLYKDAKQEVVEAFTRDFLEELLVRHRWNVSASAREAGVSRRWISRLAQRYGLKPR